MRSVVSASPEAITPFLIGEKAYRHGRYLEAGRNFANPFEHDTTFALAALRLYIVNAWNVDAFTLGSWLQRAWQHREKLSTASATALWIVSRIASSSRRASGASDAK